MFDVQLAVGLINQWIGLALPDERVRAYYDQRVEVGNDALLKFRVVLRTGNIIFDFEVLESVMNDPVSVSESLKATVEARGLAGIVYAHILTADAGRVDDPGLTMGVDLAHGDEQTVGTVVDLASLDANPLAGYGDGVTDFFAGDDEPVPEAAPAKAAPKPRKPKPKTKKA